MLRTLMNKKKRGAALVEYGLLIAGVALIGAAAVSVFGHKTSDLVAAVATILPGVHEDDNGPMVSGKLIETTPGSAAGAPIALDAAGIAALGGQPRMGDNILGAAVNSPGTSNVLATLVTEAN